MGFYRTFWHQLVRQPFSSVSTFVARDVLGLPPKSSIERYTNVFFVFLFSTGLHVIIDVVQGIPKEESGAVMLYMCAPLGLMIEEVVQKAWKSISTPKGDATLRCRDCTLPSFELAAY